MQPPLVVAPFLLPFSRQLLFYVLLLQVTVLSVVLNPVVSLTLILSTLIRYREDVARKKDNGAAVVVRVGDVMRYVWVQGKLARN
jgi:hypothetical protein